MTHRDFLAACKRAGRNPKEIKNWRAYMRGWNQVRVRKQK